MRLREPGRPISQPTLELIYAFLDAVERELNGYVFSLLLDVEARVVQTVEDCPEFPRLCVQFTWPVPDRGAHRYEKSLSLPELKELSELSAAGQLNFIHCFTECMISGLALARVVSEEE